MPRLIDDLRAAGGLAIPPFVLPERRDAWQALAEQLYPVLCHPELPVLTIENIARFLYSDSGQEYWNLETDFPDLTPPFPVFWSEHALPERIHSFALGDTDITPWVRQGRVGVLIHGLGRRDFTGDVPPSVCQVLWCEIFLDYGDGVIQGLHGSIFVAVDADGHIVENPWMQSFASADDAESQKSLQSLLNPTFLAMQYLHSNPAARTAAAANHGAEL